MSARDDDDAIVKVVAKNLKKYLDIQRREDAFDLTDLHNTSSENSTRFKLLEQSQVKHSDLEELTKVTLLQQQKFRTMKSSTEKPNLSEQTHTTRFSSPLRASPYTCPVVNPHQRAVRSLLTKEEIVKRRKKKRATSAGRVGRGHNRFFQTAISQGHTKPLDEMDSFPSILELRKIEHKDMDTSDRLDISSKDFEKTLSGATVSLNSKTKLESDSARSDALVKKSTQYPSSILRPKTASVHQSKKKSLLTNFVDSSSEEEENQQSEVIETEPLKIPKIAWSEEHYLSIRPSNQIETKDESDELSGDSSDDSDSKTNDMSMQTKRTDGSPSKIVTYGIYIITGNRPGAGTSAKVKVNLFGEHGNTGDRLLVKSKVNKVPFQKNQLDVFRLDCLSLGNLSSIRIGHDSSSAEDGWYVEKIIVSGGGKSVNSHEFLCKKWFSAQEGDGQIVRDILVSGLVPPSHLAQISKQYSNIQTDVKSADDVSCVNTTLANNTDKGNSKKTRKNAGGSFVPSSDSETEKEQRNIEKLKRREKRLSREVPSDRPHANVGGIVNKSSHSLRSSGSSNNANIQQPTQKDPQGILENKSPTINESDEVLNVRESLTDGSNVNENNTPQVNNEDKTERSNKDNVKKYSIPDSFTNKDDLYMAGFLAGVKASEIKKDDENNENKKKQEFEEKIKNGPTIHVACETGNLDRLKELISLVPDLKNKADERGWRPVHISAAYGHLDLLKWLSAIDVILTQQTPTGYTAIHLAAMNGHVNCIMILAAMGCAIGARTVDQFTPLHLAVMSGHIECVKWLISNRAKIDVKDSHERTPLVLAEEYKHEECIKLLEALKKDLSRKDSVMAMLRDPNALRYPSADPTEFLMQARGVDSGVGENEEEEWVSDTEGTSDVVGRGGDDRSEEVRRISVQTGRKESTANRHKSAPVSSKGRRISKQDMRQSNEMEEKKKLYQKQVKKLAVRKTSFLDSIRAEIEEDEAEDNIV